MVSKLHDILKPFLLRRVTSDVETSLPPKREIVLYAPLTAKQLEIEKKLVDKTLVSEIQAQQKKGGRSACPPLRIYMCLLFDRLLYCSGSGVLLSPTQLSWQKADYALSIMPP